MKEKLKTLLSLYFTFAKIGSMTFGGGLAMMPMMQKDLGEKKGWITDDELLDYYAIGQSTPGIVAVNVSTFIGFKLCGVLGGIIATFGIVTPSLVIIMILASFINSISEYPFVSRALSGVNVAVGALLTRVSYDFAKKTLKNPFAILIALTSFILVAFLKVQSFFIIIGAIALGSILHFWLNRKEKAEEMNGKKSEEKSSKRVEELNKEESHE